MKKELQKAFQIPEGLIVEDLKEEEPHKTVVYCRAKKRKVCCKGKGCGGDCKPYDIRQVNKRHTVVGGKTIWLHITRRRVKCRACGKVFVEPIEGVVRSQFTPHMIQQIQEKARNSDHTSVGHEMGVSCATVGRQVWKLDIGAFKTPKKTN